MHFMVARYIFHQNGPRRLPKRQPAGTVGRAPGGAMRLDSGHSAIAADDSFTPAQQTSPQTNLRFKAFRGKLGSQVWRETPGTY